MSKWINLLLTVGLLWWLLDDASLARPPAPRLPQPPAPDEQGAPATGPGRSPLRGGRAATGDGKPIGAFHIDYQTEFSQVQADYLMNASLNGVEGPLEALDLLAAAQSLGFRVAIAMGTTVDYINPDGTFSDAKFRSQLNEFALYAGQLAPYIADGTFFAHTMFDEPCDATKWGGEPISREKIKAASDYSKKLFPDLPTSVGMGGCMGILQPGDLDLPLAPYTQAKGTIGQYIAEQIALLEDNGFSDPRIILSINVMGGGTPPPDQVARDAIKACQQPNVAMILWWEWHGSEDFASVVNADPDYQQAVRNAAAACAAGQPTQLFLPLILS